VDVRLTYSCPICTLPRCGHPFDPDGYGRTALPKVELDQRTSEFALELLGAAWVDETEQSSALAAELVSRSNAVFVVLAGQA
jgi:hypothetical protein